MIYQVVQKVNKNNTGELKKQFQKGKNIFKKTNIVCNKLTAFYVKMFPFAAVSIYILDKKKIVDIGYTLLLKRF